MGRLRGSPAKGFCRGCAMLPDIPDNGDLGATCLRVMLAIALNQPDATERRAMLQILEDDGWIAPREDAA